MEIFLLCGSDPVIYKNPCILMQFPQKYAFQNEIPPSDCYWNAGVGRFFFVLWRCSSLCLALSGAFDWWANFEKKGQLVFCIHWRLHSCSNNNNKTTNDSCWKGSEIIMNKSKTMKKTRVMANTSIKKYSDEISIGLFFFSPVSLQLFTTVITG